MALQLSNNYAIRTISGSGENTTDNTVLVVFRTPSGTVQNGGVFSLSSASSQRYFGARIASGILEVGARTASQTPINMGAVSPSTQYVVSVTKTAAGAISARVNNGAAATASVTVGTVSYNRYAVGSYYSSSVSGFLATSNYEICYVQAFNRVLSTAELDAFHAGNLPGIDSTGRIDGHDLISDLDSDFSGTALTFTDAESDPPSFTSWDPFAAAYSIANVNGGNPVIPGQAATWTATGFAPNSATLDGIACLSVSSLGFTPPGYADEANNPRPGSRLLVASEGANTASATVPVGAIPGYKYQTLASVSASLYSVVKDMDADIGDFVVYPDADGNNVTDAGEIETNHEGSQVFWLIKGDTGYGLSYNVLTGPGGELIDVNRSLTAKSLTMIGLTMRSLTASGL